MRYPAMALAALLLVGCGDGPAGPGDDILLRVEGTVTSATTGNPIGGCKVELSGLGFAERAGTTHTNPDGRYSIRYNYVRCNDWTLWVVADPVNYERGQARVRCTEELQVHDFSLEPEAP